MKVSGGALPSQYFVLNCLKAGAVDFVVNPPFDRKTLIVKVARLSRPKAGSSVIRIPA
jgi:FixJ family two-component response regulator